MSNNVQVFVRIRPLISKNDNIVEVFNDNKILSLTNFKIKNCSNTADSRERIKYFNYDYCFGENSTQEDIYIGIKESIFKSLLSKYHTCIFAYGQSATGKTYTMIGNENEIGLIPRICQQLFDTFNQQLNMYNIFVSYLEIYNEKVQDLLVNDDEKRVQLKVREHPEKGPHVPGLTEHQVINQSQLMACFLRGNKNRTVAATVQNCESSRSHSVFIVKFQCTITATGANSVFYLYMVDLAGSEKAVTKSQLLEGASINRSLVSLTNVITALAFRKKFVPYRDSTLTWLLKDVMGENSRTIMIATISGSKLNYSETLNTLRFGQRVKKIKSIPKVNENRTERIIEELTIENCQLKNLLAEYSQRKSYRNQVTQTYNENRTKIVAPDLITNHQIAPQLKKYSQQSYEIILNDFLEQSNIFEIVPRFCSVNFEKNDSKIAKKSRVLVYCLARIEFSTFRATMTEFLKNAFELIEHLKLAASILSAGSSATQNISNQN